jgi:pyridoxine 5'-phosphate synthase PdxJ
MARAIFTGLPAAVAAMKTLCQAYPAHAGGR